MRLTSKGQVTIPIEIRDQLGLTPGTVVDFEVEGDAVRVTKAKVGQDRGASLVQAMRGRGDVELSTDEIMALTRGE
jgi:antitoxin PrlF